MKLSNEMIIAAKPAIEKLLNTSLPVRQAYKISKTSIALKQQYSFIEKQRNELIKKYGVEKDGTYEISPDDYIQKEKFFKEYLELLAMEENIDVRTLTLNDIECVQLTANELSAIDFMISED